MKNVRNSNCNGNRMLNHLRHKRKPTYFFTPAYLTFFNLNNAFTQMLLQSHKFQILCNFDQVITSCLGNYRVSIYSPLFTCVWYAGDMRNTHNLHSVALHVFYEKNFYMKMSLKNPPRLRKFGKKMISLQKKPSYINKCLESAIFLTSWKF